MTSIPVTEDQHYERLNSYRHSREYHIYRDAIGDESGRNPDEFPSLLDFRWEIPESVYMHFLETLPPLEMNRTGFTFAEFAFGEFTTRYTQEGNRYFCQFIRQKGGPQ